MSQIIRMSLLLLAALTAVPAQAEETRRDEFDDWGFVCTRPDGQEDAPESCNLFQTALLNNEAGEPGQRVLLTRVGYTAESENPVLLVTAPLGILLPLGITVEVEGHDAIRIPLQRCDGGGCLGFAVMETALLEAFRAAGQARVTIYDAQRRGVTIPLSLKGFTKGMEELADSRED